VESSRTWDFAQKALARMRRNYPTERLLESAVASEPFAQFHSWLRAAVAAGLPEPNAMVLATATSDGRPSARHVLLKELDDTGFVFFTNLGSRKAAEISANPAVSLCFPWFAMARQVVASGTAAPVSRGETEKYWATRPRESQLGAWASDQSSVIASRAELEAAAASAAARFPETVPVPPFWGGFRVSPHTVEFWQGGPARLHDRLRYTRTEDGWRLQRLAP
jgi:pyridoxamine 5'-phosphate oxidase